MRRVIAIAGVAGLVLLAAGVFCLLGPAIRNYRETSTLERAKVCLERGDLPNAALSARQLLELNPNHVEACRLMARLVELGHEPSSLYWHWRVAELSARPEDKWELAARSLDVESAPWPLATRILEETAEAGAEVAAFHLVAAELALKRQAWADAEKHWKKASALEPENARHRLNLAALRLRSTNAMVAREARLVLEDLRTNAWLRAPALRWLIRDRITRREWPAAEQFSDELLRDPAAALEDHLTRLRVLRESGPAEFTPALIAVQALVATNATGIARLAAWMIEHAMASEAFAWLSCQPEPLLASYPVELALAQACVALTNWPALETALEGRQWHEMEFLRLAFLARAAHAQYRPQAAQALWRLAIQRTDDRFEALAALLGMAADCGQPSSSQDLLWRVLRRFPSEAWAARALERSYVDAGNTAGLHRLYEAQMVQISGSPIISNNFAATAFLLKLDLPKAHALSQELHAANPNDPVFSATYAFSLHLQHRTRDGLAAFEQLTAHDLEQPTVALYYGLLLWADGQTNRALPYLKLGQATRLLPEERALIPAAARIEPSAP